MRLVLLLLFIPAAVITQPVMAQLVIQIGGSVAFPISEGFRDGWRPGVTGYAGVAIPFQRLQVFLSGTASRFDLDEAFLKERAGLRSGVSIRGGEVQIYSGVLGVRYMNRARKISPYGEIGGGAYHVRVSGITAREAGASVTIEGGQDTYPGFVGGVGVLIPINLHLRLTLGPRFNYLISDGDNNYATFRLTIVIL